MKLPSFQFYPGDWMKDPNLRRCSRAARGLWADMLCLMFECEDRGVLATGGEPWSDEDIAAASGGDIAEGLSCLLELLRKGVARRNQAGAIFSKRMVKDEQERRAAAERKRKEREMSRESRAPVTPLSQDNHTPSSSSPSPSGIHTHASARAREEIPKPPEPQSGESKAVGVFREIYAAQPDNYSADRINLEVKDCDLWRQILVEKRANGIPATKVGTLLNVYRDQVAKSDNGTGNGLAEKKIGCR